MHYGNNVEIFLSSTRKKKKRKNIFNFLISCCIWNGKYVALTLKKCTINSRKKKKYERKKPFTISNFISKL